MRRDRSVVLVVAVLALAGSLLLASRLFASEGQGQAQAQDQARQAAAEQVAAWMKYALPGEHHQHLQKLVGKWKAAGKFWAQPGAPPIEAQGTAEITSVLGGRFFRTDYSGAFMGQEFVGFGLDGYDNYARKHVGMWVDTMGTMMMGFEGNCEDGGKVTRMVAAYNDPMTGSLKKMKGVTTVVSDNQFTYTAYDVDEGGAEVKTMEIVYTRM